MQFSPNEVFEAFKDDYRVVIGMVFAEVHGSKLIPSLTLKEKLKLKILCCHTINRVFENGPGEDYWLWMREWMKNNIENNQKSN